MFQSAGLPATSDPITPALAASRPNASAWKPVKVFSGVLGISGGFNKKALGVPSLEFTTRGQTHRFVELAKNAEWFLKGVGGDKTQKGDLKSVKVFDLIRASFMSAMLNSVDDEVDLLSAVAEATSVAEDDLDDEEKEVDPMDELEESMETPKKAAKKAPQSRQKKKVLNKSVMKELQLPRRPACVGADGDTTVTVYSKGGQNHKKMSIYIRVDCVDWLLSYAADEHSSQGVKSASIEDFGVKQPNCTAVADLNLEWDFRAKAWEAEFVSGPLKGVTRSFGTADLTTDVRSKMEAAGIGKELLGLQLSYGLAEKRLAKAFITAWCHADSVGNDNFAREWDLMESGGTPCTPIKKRRQEAP